MTSGQLWPGAQNAAFSPLKEVLFQFVAASVADMPQPNASLGCRVP
jgi:hypothetical protein